jgi:uncharacterized protein (DUF58 family)
MSAPPHSTPEALLRRLEWRVIRRLDGLLQGDYRTLFRGFGVDLADLREYQYHDDVRHIDWNVTARLQTPYVREYHEDREVCAWFVLDVSASQEFGSSGQKKRTVLAEFVAILARLLSRHGNRVGALLYGDAAHAVIAPRTGRRHVLHILQRLLAPVSRSRSAQTDVGAMLERAQRVMTRRSLVFVVSDFISATPWEAALARLAMTHETIAVRVHDALERGLPDLGLLVVEDAETGEQLLLDTHDRAFRRRFEAAATQRERALRAAFAGAGVDALELSTDGDLVDAVLRFAELRKLRRHGIGHGGALHVEVTT